jgi:GDP-mannose 6-dehydrogenase
VSAACLVRDGNQVIGVDVDERKLELLRSGRAPIVEDGIQDLTESAISSGQFTVTNDSRIAISGSDISFICVGTPSRHNGSQDLRAIHLVAEQIGTALRDISHFHCVVIRSTVEPGTVDGDIRKIIEQHSGKRAGSDFGICFQPEFLREGSSIQDYDNPPFTIVGTTSDRSAEMLRSLFGHLPCEFIVTDIGSAEIMKYACNCFHALKITFANELGRIAHGFGIDSRNVMDLLCRDHHLNISAAYLRPGFAFGGSCLPKDLRALMYMAKSKDISTPMLANVMTSNAAHLKQAIDVVLNSGARRVGIIGLSFKSGTDDLRESPLVAMAEHLIGKGIDLKIYDPQVNLSLLIGANKSYIEKHIPHIAAHLTNNCRGAVSGAEAIVVGADLPDAYKVIAAESRNDQLVLDLVGNLSPDTIAGKYRGLCW